MARVIKAKMEVVTAAYRSLVKAVREELDGLEFLVRRRTAESYWRVGQFIHEHLLQGQERSDHGSQFFSKLAEDVGRDSSTLLKILRFYRAYPNLARGPDLSWSHYRVLLSVKDGKHRRVLEQKIVKNNWDAQQLQEHLRSQRTLEAAKDPDAPVPQLKLTRGQLHIYKAVELKLGRTQTALMIDYGFGVCRAFPKASASGIKDGTLLTVRGRGYDIIDIPDDLRYTHTLLTTCFALFDEKNSRSS